MKGQWTMVLAIAGVTLAAAGILAGSLYFQGQESSEENRTLAGASFTIEEVVESTVLVRNTGGGPISREEMTVRVNGRLVDHSQDGPVEPGSVGELALPLQPGECPAQVEVSSGAIIKSRRADLCLYAQEFEGNVSWEDEGADSEVSGGVLEVRNGEDTGMTLSSRTVEREKWTMEARVRGSGPEVLFLHGNATGYGLGIEPAGNDTEASFWKGDVRRDSHTYSWAWDRSGWHRLKVVSEGDGVYFGKVWPERREEPDEWKLFLIDTEMEGGRLGLFLDTAGEEAEMDWIRVYPTPPV